MNDTKVSLKCKVEKRTNQLLLEQVIIDGLSITQPTIFYYSLPKEDTAISTTINIANIDRCIYPETSDSNIIKQASQMIGSSFND